MKTTQTDKLLPRRLKKLRQRLGNRGIWGLLALLQVFLLLILLLTWPPVRLTLVVPASETAYWSGLVEEFEADRSNIQINLVGLSNTQGDLTDRLRELCAIDIMAGNSLCDLIYMDIIWVPEFAATGRLLDLSDRLSPAELSEFINSEIVSDLSQEGLYRIPFRSDIGLLYYRKDLLEQAGYQLPDTFQQLLTISKDLQSQGAAEWGYLWQGRSYEGLSAVFIEVLRGYGGFWLDSETLDVGLDRPEAAQAVRFLLQTMEAQVSPSAFLAYSEANTLAEFKQEKAVFLRNWPYVWSELNAEDSPLRGKVGIHPMTLHAAAHQGSACRGSWGLSIARTSQHPREAWQAIEYFTSARAQRRFVLDAGYIPSREEIFNDPEVARKYPHIPKLAEAVKNSVLRPPIPQYAQASEILQRHLSEALRQQVSPEAAMQAAAAETRRLLESD